MSHQPNGGRSRTDLAPIAVQLDVRRRQRTVGIESHAAQAALNETERAVLAVVHPEFEVTAADLAGALPYTKAQVSRALATLRARQLVEARRLPRTSVNVWRLA